MIKRIRLANSFEGGGEFRSAWRMSVAGALDAPAGARPLRVALCTALPELAPEPVHDVIGIEWFSDAEHVARFESWLASPDGGAVDEALTRRVDPDGHAVIVADERVMRGEDWLDDRWRRGGDKVKHMAFARRAEGLTPAQFSELWRSRAGRVGSVVIPDEARGHAYVQNHPVARADGDWAYDAVNEVYFDDVDGVRARIEWFAESSVQQAEDDLVDQAAFVVVREEVL